MSYWLFILLCVSQALQAMPTVSNLLTRVDEEPDQLVRFLKAPGPLQAKSTVQLHFLESNDCQSGYRVKFETLDDGVDFSLEADQIFGLRGSEVYQAGISVLSNIQEIHSVMIRLVRYHKQFARFVGTCDDQQINCCIPIRCDVDTGICRAQYDVGLQAMM